MKPNFSGWATKNNLQCSDGRTIMPDAFKHQDGARVPLVWNHDHNDPANIIGYAVLHHRDEGVWTDAYLNGSDRATEVKGLIQHGDVNQLSIHANKLKEAAKQVFHGMIREVSVVLSGANPGAFIQDVNLSHSEDDAIEDAIIWTGLEITHADNSDEGKKVADTQTEAQGDKTIKDVVDSMNEEQKNVLYYLVGEAGEESSAKHSDNDDDSLEHKEGTTVSRNIFDNGDGTQTEVGATLTHAQQQAILNDAKRMGSFHDAILMHAENYGVQNIELLFPEAKALTNTPEFIKRETEWVSGVLSGVNKVPFARIKSMSADITHEEARARGYIKGNLKKEEFFGLKSRKTGPTTIYKKQKLDRDDIIDATTLDVVNWLWAEMRLMLNEEIARAILIGDGRPSEDPSNPAEPNPDKVREPVNSLSDGDGIRSIMNDHEFYAYQVALPNGQSVQNLTDQIIRQRRYFKGTGTPTFYTTEDILNDLLLQRDKMGQRLYKSVAELASDLRVKEIVPVEVFESVPDLIGIMVNLKDYTVGTDKGGEITTFDDFDIDYNQYKYLIEGRMSGTLTRYRSAIVIKRVAGTEVTPVAPTFNPDTNTLTIPSVTGLEYSLNNSVVAAGDIVITEDAFVDVVAKDNYYIKPNSTSDWVFEFNAQAGA